ncbi:hypothetical protein [Acuticoccus sp.]|uniref:hypothetical protein n=1 Tax=Acuticoccus sp. TaxID=1904378 RepID=UPI003B52F971
MTTTRRDIVPLQRKTHKYRFGTIGLREQDVSAIEAKIKKYGGEPVYRTDDTEFLSARELIASNAAHNSFFLSAYRKRGSSGPFFHLTIGGSLSTWEVEELPNGTPADQAVANQLFQEVRNVLSNRSALVPNRPLVIARNTVVYLPLILLVLEHLFTPVWLGGAAILQITLVVTFFHVMFSWVERRRWNKSAVVQPKRYVNQITKRWPEIVVVIVGSLFAVMLTRMLDCLSSLLERTL